MWRLLFLSSTSAALVAGCSDNCGPHGAPDFGLIASSDQININFGQLKAGANNDCPAADAPPGVISLTIAGIQKDDPTHLITLCVSRPDTLGDHSQTLGTEVKLIDLTGADAMCTYTVDTTRPTAGTVQGNGICDNGTNKAGFELIVNGALSIARDCGGIKDTQAVTLRGTVAVMPM